MLLLQIFLLYGVLSSVQNNKKSININQQNTILSSAKNILATTSVPFVREAGMMIISTDGINFSKHWHKFLTNGENPDGTWANTPSNNDAQPSGNFTFIGTQCYLVANQSPDSGNLRVYIDDLMTKTINLLNSASKDLNRTFTIYKNDLDFKEHTAQIRIPAANNKKIEIVCFLIRPYPVDRGGFIEAPDMIYDPEYWELKSGNTQLHSKSSKSTVKIEFVGNQFYYYGTLNENYGSVSFILNGEKVGEASHKGTLRYNSLLFTSKILPYTSHKLEIQMNDDNPVEIGTFYFLKPNSSETPIVEQTIEFSKSFEFSNSNNFTKSQVFSNSKGFSESNIFSKTQIFSNSNNFSISNKFNNSDQFSSSKYFSDSFKFSQSEKFSQSKQFSYSKEFNASNKFTESKKINKFSNSNKFSESTKFSKSSEFLPSNKFSESVKFSKSCEFIASNKFTSSEKFTQSETLSEYGHFSKENDLSNLIPSSKFTQSNKFSNSNKFSQSSKFTESNKFIQIFTSKANDKTLTDSQIMITEKIETNSRIVTINQQEESNKNDVGFSFQPINGTGNSLKGNKKSNISLIAGIVSALIALIIIAVVVIILYIKKKKHNEKDSDDLSIEEKTTITINEKSETVFNNPLYDNYCNSHDPFDDNFDEDEIL